MNILGATRTLKNQIVTSMESDNPYANPTVHAKDLEPKAREKYTPIFIGVVVGLGVLYAISAIWSTPYIWILTSSGVSGQDLYKYIYQSTGVLLFSHATAVFSEAVGGYWCVKLSRSQPLTNAALAAVVSCAITGVQLLSPYADLVPQWSRAVSLLTPIIGFILGARYAMRKVRPIP